MDTKIMLLVVDNREKIMTEYAKWLMSVAWNREVAGYKFWNSTRRAIWYMRHEMIREALKKTDCTHVLFVDTDTIPPVGSIKKLVAHNKDIVSGIYFDGAGRPCNRKKGKPYIGKGLEQVDVLSMGFSLWKREVLEKVEYPMPEPLCKLDADTEFCKLLKLQGYEIYQDFDVRAYHILTMPFINNNETYEE